MNIAQFIKNHIIKDNLVGFIIRYKYLKHFNIDEKNISFDFTWNDLYEGNQIFAKLSKYE